MPCIVSCGGQLVIVKAIKMALHGKDNSETGIPTTINQQSHVHSQLSYEAKELQFCKWLFHQNLVENKRQGGKTKRLKLECEKKKLPIKKVK